jgi:hypothetical protein
MQKGGAALTALGLVMASAAIGGSFGPTPDRPRTALWYLLLRKPDFTPPGPLIGATWSILDILLIVPGYRLLAAPRSERRTRCFNRMGDQRDWRRRSSFAVFRAQEHDRRLGRGGILDCLVGDGGDRRG